MGKSQRTKGHSFERNTAIRWRRVFPNAMRNLDDVYGGVGVDLKNTGALLPQCKSYKKYAPISKIFEVQGEGIPVLVTKGDRLPPIVCMFESDFLDILEDVGVAYDKNVSALREKDSHK